MPYDVDPARAGPLLHGSERLLIVGDKEILTGMLSDVLTPFVYRFTVCNWSDEAIGLFEAHAREYAILTSPRSCSIH